MPKKNGLGFSELSNTQRHRVFRRVRERINKELNELQEGAHNRIQVEADRVAAANENVNPPVEAQEHDLEDRNEANVIRPLNGENDRLAVQENNVNEVPLNNGNNEGNNDVNADERNIEGEEDAGDESDDAVAGSKGSDDEGNQADANNDRNLSDDEEGAAYDERDLHDDILAEFGNRPLYLGAQLTVSDSVALLMTFLLNHDVTGTTLEDFLRILELHCPETDFVKLSLYKLRKYFQFTSGPVRKKFYCSVCFKGLVTPRDMCPVCLRMQPVSYFLQMPIIPQLKQLYARPTFFNHLQHKFFRRPINEGCLEDIYDGQLYSEHVHQGFLSNPHNFSMTHYTDGVPVFQSKNYSFWPFCLTINELPYKLRVKKENMVIAGLWFGPQKPQANLFMSSLIDDFRSIYIGFNVFAAGIQQEILVRGIVLAGVADTPARSTFMNCQAHNGFYGCPLCEITGETILLPTGSNTHSYRYEHPIQKRTVARMLEQAAEAQRINEPFMGVKGPTALRLFMPDFIRGTGIDIMHLISGICCKYMMLLFDSKNGGEDYSLRDAIGAVDKMLLSLKPPKFIHRFPRSVRDHCHWKASEFKVWFFYCSVVILKVVMAPRYYDHYLKLVTAISYLCDSSISLAMIDRADQLLHEFVRDFQNLYGLKFCSINFHMLLHLAGCVRELGPLWVYTCFPYESINGEILSVIHGKTNIDSQIARMHWQWLTLPKKLNNLREGPIKDFCLKGRRVQLKTSERLYESCYVVGSYSRTEVGNGLITQALRHSNINFRRFLTYTRFLKDKMLYVSEKYTRDLRSSSSFVAFSRENSISFGTVYIFVKVLLCECNFICDCDGQHFAIVRGTEKVSDIRLFHHNNTYLHYMHECRMSLNISAVPISDLETVCFFLNVNNALYLAKPINPYEME